MTKSTPPPLLVSAKPSGQEPNAKATFRRLDPQSESLVLDRLCHEFELVRAETKTLDDCIVILRGAMAIVHTPDCVHSQQAGGNGHTPTAEPYMKEPLYELLHIILEGQMDQVGGLSGAIEKAKPILRTAMQLLRVQLDRDGTLVMADKPAPSSPHRQDPLQFQNADTWRMQRAVKLLLEVPEALWDAPSVIPIMRQAIKLGAFLMGKNKAYGDSALNPVRVFSKADPAEQIRVRLDDKLSRLVRGQTGGEDALLDLVGYYILLKVAEEDSHG